MVVVEMNECIELELTEDYKRGWIEGTNLKLPCSHCKHFGSSFGYCYHPKVTEKVTPAFIKFVGCGWFEK